MTNTRTNTIDGVKTQFVMVGGRKTSTYTADGKIGIVFDQRARI